MRLTRKTLKTSDETVTRGEDQGVGRVTEVDLGRGKEDGGESPTPVREYVKRAKGLLEIRLPRSSLLTQETILMRYRERKYNSLTLLRV